jgi:First Longin domain of INTU, CCZ1 and HPS4
MSYPSSAPTSVVPAQLATLSIYNPSLGATDETVRDQILYYYARTQRERNEANRNHGSDNSDESEEEENQKLREIGLAQGMVDLAK